MSYSSLCYGFVFLLTGYSLQAQEADFRQTIQPDVTRRETSYPDIRLNAGDILHLEAGGCVQTGGSGLTWKRFVNPSGEDSYRYYFGLVAIPGITLQLERIDKYLGRDITIPAGYSGNLILGYEDQPGSYNDNGYEGKDDGTEGQCVGEGNAYVTIVIKHSAPEKSPATTDGGNNQPADNSNNHNNQNNQGNHDNSPKDNSALPLQSTAPSKPFLETATGIIVIITAFITAIVAFIKLFKKG